MSTDPNKKTVREIIYYVHDHRAMAQAALSGQGFAVDEEIGESAILDTDAGDILILKEGKATRRITMPKTGYVFREERTIVRDRKADEYPK